MNQKRLLQSRSSSKKRNSDPSAADDGTPLPIRILLTGFKPFAKRESNPSETAVRRFSVREIQSRYGLVLDKRILRVSRDAPRDLVEATGSYDIVLHLGVGRQIPAIQLEHLAYNKVNADLRDPSGKKGRNNPIVDGGPWILKSTLPIANHR